MRDEVHQRTIESRPEQASTFPVIKRRQHVLLKILNAGKSFWFLVNNLK
jgi:hypothetical protein